jgi:hypothetical protein
MKTRKQRYCLIVHARADEQIGAERRHTRFFEEIKDLPAPWGVGDRAIPRAPNVRHGSLDAIDLTKVFSGAAKSAMVTYCPRGKLSDDGYSDDRLFVDIDPAKVDLNHFAMEVIPRYIEAFDGYRAECFDEEFVHDAYENQGDEEQPVGSQEHDNPRMTALEVMPISFFDELLCRRAFNVTPAEVLERMRGKVEYAQLLHGGVYLVGSSRSLPFEEAQSLSKEMTRTLLG